MSEEITVVLETGDEIAVTVSNDLVIPVELMAGVPGTDGRSVRSGPADPLGTDGYEGDFWINTTTNTLFGPKVGLVWGAGVLLVGPSPTIAAGAVTTLPPGELATVVNVGTPLAAVFDFEIPQGVKGDKGDAATVAVGTVTTGAAGSAASVTNVGTPTDAIFDIAIPQGVQGIQGDPGPGVPAGGAPGQTLHKFGEEDYATGWAYNEAGEVVVVPTGNLTSVDVQAALEELQVDVDTRATGVDLLEHTGNTLNPHGTTAAQVGAPTVADLTAHTGDTLNPHATTAAQVGAPTVADLTAHTGDTANPHGVTKTQVGLGNVPNVDTTNPANITEDATHRFATDAEKTLWNAQDALKIKGVIVNDAAKADKKVLQYDQATDRVIYADAAGGGGGGSLRWLEDLAAPISSVAGGMLGYQFEPLLLQKMHTLVRVPSSFIPGKQIKLRLPWYCASTSGPVTLNADSILVLFGVSAPAQAGPVRNYTAAPVTMAAGNASVVQETVLELTSATGTIGAETVQPGQLIRVTIFRTSTDNTATAAILLLDGAEVTFT